jgi:CRP-like cAMP-binding protein
MDPLRAAEGLREGPLGVRLFAPAEPDVPELDSRPVIRPTALELFRDLSDAERQGIARFCPERRYRKDATIFSEGDPGDAMFIVTEGLVKLVSVSDKGTETILHLLKPDEIFGELLFAEERRAFDAVASTEVRVVTISRKGFEEILASLPGVARNFIRLLSRRLVRVERGLAGFGHSWSYHRLGRVLLQLAKEHGAPTPGGTRISLRLTHEDLAKLIGTTRETVSTQINRFKRMGLLKREGQHYVVETDRLTRFLAPAEGATTPGRETILGSY